MTDCILEHIQKSSKKGKKLLAILLDPDKTKLQEISIVSKRIENLKANFIFVGGSFVEKGITDVFVQKLKEFTNIPIILFPGDYSQVTNKADGLLFLSLISGRNPEYLIEQQIKAVPFLKNSNLEIIPTGYILIDGGINSSVLKISKTTAISQNNIELTVETAIAGMYKGKQLIYLEAGSGAKFPVNSKLITEVKKNINIPLIVGGGIRTKEQLKNAYKNGADVVVIGTAFENNINLSI
ncbi:MULTISPECIES: geranylgeranylglyceryl/heptaprenylglyceryl phosphate synthase [Flavobacteriaceae]|uniref:Geranylgeranylglyceryl phosphate synthase n=2 Tax=Flavobacteriaceae TaxID=49546 RepID=A0A4Y8ARM0_9FLAO|nr:MULTISPECIES: geranylgeranylglyceryl/heptaprenylglyceryl phosphate synthase [Flavobacteriaceae]TEW72864.1 geranylgeranylglyceryl/heptaprenylglyceryl phosphate synthase [Gramella jeungdoensis]GGK49029.1 geranylgeranylglyceryl phosphate synthase [Lutibacter litoralis]